MPEYNIGMISYLSKKNFWILADQQKFALEDIDDSVKLSENQQRFVNAYLDKEILIDQEKIKEWMNKLEYPLYYIDYETFAPAVPLLNNYGCHEKIVFQFSLHIQAEPGGGCKHDFFLLEDIQKQEDIIQHLKSHIGPTGSLIAWNDSFEAGCHKLLAVKYPDHESFLLDLNDRMVDLMDIFSKDYYVDYRFQDSASLKKVLPILCPDLSYEGMDINEGNLASYRWKKAFADEDPEYDKAKVKEDLLKYCHLDTLAMVEILWKLYEAID